MSSECASVTRHTSEDGDEPFFRRYTRKEKTAASEERQSSAWPIPTYVYVAYGHLVQQFSRVDCIALARKYDIENGLAYQ